VDDPGGAYVERKIRTICVQPTAVEHLEITSMRSPSLSA
jgi:hypothetical protein